MISRAPRPGVTQLIDQPVRPPRTPLDALQPNPAVGALHRACDLTFGP